MSIEQIRQGSGAEHSESTAEQRRLRQACQEFESLFLAHLLKTMRESSSEEGLFGEGLGGDIYQSLFETEVARKMAQAGGVGLADLLYRSLVQEARQQVPSRVPEPSIGGPAPTRVARYDAYIRDACQRYDMPLHLVYAVIHHESAGNPHAVSAKNAKGLMQLTDQTARHLRVRNVFDPKENILAGVRYLRQMLDRFAGDIKLALAAYNAGPGAVQKHNGVPPYAETQKFVERVLTTAERYRRLLADGTSPGPEVGDDGV
ncbi:MAG: transglycosylase SLT domain-containing protein [Calditrichaeota bacterium]|nr:transglycosylase SLT domain-containing protein [Calditrichota bacterium]